MALVDGLHLVRVLLSSDSGSPGNSYDLDLLQTSLEPNCSAGDYFEPNDSFATASPLIDGAVSALSVCSTGDEDYYEFPLFTGETLELSLAFDHGEGDIDLELLDSSGTVVASSFSSTDDEFLSYAVPSSGNYVIRVVLTLDTGALTGNSYEIETIIL